jgi:hypothetical protein
MMALKPKHVANANIKKDNKYRDNKIIIYTAVCDGYYIYIYIFYKPQQGGNNITYNLYALVDRLTPTTIVGLQ